MSFQHVVVGVLLHMRIAHVHAAFLYPSNGSADCVQIKCAVRNRLGDNQLSSELNPLHFPKRMGKSSRPRVRDVRYFFDLYETVHTSPALRTWPLPPPALPRA